MTYPVLFVWGLVIASAVLGRMIEKDTNYDDQEEVLDQNPTLTLEQARFWMNEFWSSRHRHISHVEYLSENPYSTAELKPTFYHSSDRQNSRAHQFRDYSPLHDRINTRHYDVSDINYPYEKKPLVKTENLEWALRNIFSYPRNHATNETAKNFVLKHISDSMQLTSGLNVQVQQFQPLQFLTMYEGQTLPVGSNIIGIMKGKEFGTPNDRIVLVGAHWDTVNFTPGTDDNGSGVSAMLETARAISHSGCRPKYTIIYVAFDLEEVGSQGSLIFIKEYLVQMLKSSFPKDVGMAKFQGAFIMDTIMNFNDTEESQTFPRDFSLVIPEVFDQTADDKYRGDFLAMIYRRNVDNRMAEKFQYHWDRSMFDKRFKLRPFPLYLSAKLPELDVLADHLNFLRSDHARFWYMNDSSVPDTLNAVLMTDTGPYRGNMRDCYHTICDGPEISIFENPLNMKFLTKITQVLTDTLVDMSECEAEEKRVDLASASTNYIKTTKVTAKSSSYRQSSPLRNLLNFVKWMQS